MKSNGVALAICIFLLSGCASKTSSVRAIQTPKASTDNGDPKHKKHIVSITPLSKLIINSEAMDQTKNSLYSNAYTRLLLAQETQPKSEDDNDSDEIKYNDRGPIARLFWGTHHTYALSTKVVVGNFEATVPLVTMDHISNRNDGEKFLRVVYYRANAYPLFLIKGDGSNAIASIKVQVNASDSSESSIVCKLFCTAGKCNK